ncbi:MAG: transcription termination factor NusA [Candidatus Paceibacterota bacterium]|nr:MAG: transcription termination factor NusA [Candidatus Paceibacterota bacterium]
MFDLKVINSVLEQLEEERGVPKEKAFEAIESALATAYKKEYGERGQIIKAQFDPQTGQAQFFQVKIVVDENTAVADKEALEEIKAEQQDEKEPVKELFNPEHHIWIEDAKKVKKDTQVGEELVFPLESKGDFGRIASQTAKQVIIQKIREAEKVAVLKEYGAQEGEIVSGTVQRIERGNIFIDVGKATGILSFEDQIPGERFSQGERVRAYLYKVEESARGIFLRLSRTNPKFLEKLFEAEVPEISAETVVVKTVAREAGSRSKIAVASIDEHIDPVGSMVGQRGVRVSTVMSELGGEKIDIIEWSEDPKKFVEDSLSPAKVMEVEIDEKENKAIAFVTEDQQSLAIGRGGQNVRLAAKLTGWKIDVRSAKGENLAEADATGETEIKENLTE